VDLNGDGIVNIKDISMVARAFGLDIAGKWGPKCRDSTCYNSTHDFNSDGRINIIDIATVVRKFGKKCPRITQVKELGFSYSNILVVMIVVLAIATILLTLKFFWGKTGVSS